MRWMIRVEIHEGKHAHVDVPEPDVGAVVINVINEAAGSPLKYRIEQWSSVWICHECGASRLEPTGERLGAADHDEN